MGKRLSLKPKAAHIIKGKSAWWYDERGGIHICIDAGGGLIGQATIRRSALLRYIERSGK